MKQERDQTRITIDKIRMESGLLAEPELLRDMESSMSELHAIKTELEHLKRDHKTKAQHIRNIRKHIEITSEELIKTRISKMNIDKKKTKPTLMKGRPSIFQPTIASSAFDHLREHTRKNNCVIDRWFILINIIKMRQIVLHFHRPNFWY